MTENLNHPSKAARLSSKWGPLLFRLIVSPYFALMLIASPAVGVNVDDYGAVGDGVTWDHAAIQTAINAAGKRGLIEFTAGKTYVACAEIRPLHYQTLRGNGAVLKRCDAPTTQLTQDASAGSEILAVNDPSVFEIGQSLTPVKGHGGYADGEFVIKHALESVNGSVLKISNGLRQDYPAGSIVTVKFDQIRTSSLNVVIDGLVFEGNRENNNIYLSWTENRAIRSDSNVIIRNSTFQNLPGNGISAFGTNVLIADNIFRDLDGPIVHLSGNEPKNGSSVTIARNSVSNTNEQYERMIHSQGVITISSHNYSINVLDNVVENAPIPFISSFHHGMSDWLVRGNRVSGTNGIFIAKVKNNDRDPLSDITFEGNTFRNVGESWTFRKAWAEPISRFKFINNRIIGGSLNLKGLRDSRISGNTIKSCNVDPILVTDDRNVRITDNETTNDYCLLTLKSQNSPRSLVGPIEDNSYHLDIINTADAGDTTASNGITIQSVMGIISEDELENSCAPGLPATLASGEAVKCKFNIPTKENGSIASIIANILSFGKKAFTVTVNGELENGNSITYQHAIRLR